LPEIIKLVIADDHVLVRAGMRLMLSCEPDFQLLAETGNGNDVCRLVEIFRPDVLILDLGLPGIDGLEVMRRMGKIKTECRMLALSARTDLVSVRTAYTLNVHGYVPKSDDVSELIHAIRTVAQGQTYFSPAIKHMLDDDSAASPALTAREREILAHVAQGLSSKEIAARLDISPATVVKHRENLSKKLGTRNAAELAALAAMYLPLAFD
jgi:DNA-binding NarL/FixJ family response regulator